MNISKKALAVAVILLFFSVGVVPSTGIIVFNDDTTPPVTTHSLNPPEPDGDNGWYVNDVEVMLNATDDMSGVKEIRYKIGDGSLQILPGNQGMFVLDDDADDLLMNIITTQDSMEESTISITKIILEDIYKLINQSIMVLRNRWNMTSTVNMF